MAGQLGDVRVTQQNLKVISTDVERGLIMLKGSVPGAKGGYIMVRDAIKHSIPSDVPIPVAGLTDNKSNIDTNAGEQLAREEGKEAEKDLGKSENDQKVEESKTNSDKPEAKG